MKNELILLAKIGAPHGVKGEVRVLPFGDAGALDSYGKLQASDGRSFKIKRSRPQKNMLVVKFEGVNTRVEAQALNGVELFVDRGKLPEPEEDEFYVSDMVGCAVLNEAGETIGKVIDVPNFGAGDMVEIEPASSLKRAGGSYFLPFTLAVVPKVDLRNRAITVVPPPEVSERDREGTSDCETDDVPT